MMKYPKIRKCLGWMQTRLFDFYEAFQKEAPPFVCAVGVWPCVHPVVMNEAIVNRATTRDCPYRGSAWRGWFEVYELPILNHLTHD